MNIRLTLRIQGGLLLFLSAMLLVPIPVSLWYGDGAWPSFLVASAVAAGVGAPLLRRFGAREELTVREGFGVVTIAWVLYGAFGAIPYLVSGTIPDPAAAYFETMSGFTTTGSTVIRDLSRVAESILLWRALTHWLGGMGIIVLSLAILPLLGVGGMQLFEAEMPGPTKDRLRPRIQDTAKMLWGVYFLLTSAEVVALMLGGVSFFESVCHAFATMATGGFSTRNGSVGELGGSYVHWMVALFMFLAGVNFTLHYHALRGRPGRFFASEEFRFYAIVVAGAIACLFLLNLSSGPDPLTTFRDAAFQVVSIVTTTGFATADYELWPVASHYILICLMFIGSCAGSTGGGMKTIRVLLLLKHAFLTLHRVVHPRRVRVLKLDGKPVPDAVMESILGFFVFYVGIFVAASIGMAVLGCDHLTAGGSVIACLSNVGPGLGAVGPTETFAHLPAAGHVLLSLCMLVGRLEIFTVLVLVLPSFWRR